MDIMNKVIAGFIALTCGLLTSFLTYHFLGFILEPIRVWLINKLEASSNG